MRTAAAGRTGLLGFSLLMPAFAPAGRAAAQDFVFETGAARLTIRADGTVGGLVEKQNGKELPGPAGEAFAAAVKGGKAFPASAVKRRGGALHVTFGTSGIDADYRITARTDYIAVELTALRGDGVEELRLMQIHVPLANSGSILGVRWDDQFTVCLMGLGEAVNSRVEGPAVVASVYPAFGMEGEGAAIIAVPTPRFLDTVQKVERDFKLPSPALGGVWTKSSQDVRTSYLFTDLTEDNVDETIRYAKLGGFRYILVYSDTWSASLGSYPINTRNFPHGEAGLKATIDKCHAAGLKVGLHTLTSFVAKNDPLVRPNPSPWLLKDAETALGGDVSETATELAAGSPLTAFPPDGDLEIGDEIVHCGRIDGARFVQCARGFAGTQPAPHKAGARIYHLAERDGAYLADLKTPLKEAIADRVAGLINRCGFDMVYFDGAELNAADGPAWYWMGPQETAIWRKAKRELLVQGSAVAGWTWHIFSRGVCDDGAAVAVKEYLDYHKIPDYLQPYRNDFLPAELGWVSLLSDAPAYPATTPDEMEYYAVRMLALDTPVSYETSLSALKANGRSVEMLKLLGAYDQLRLSGAVGRETRLKLTAGEWHMTQPGEFHPIRYDAQRVSVPGQITIHNGFGDQPLKFRLRAEPVLAAAGDPSNAVLLREDSPLELPPPDDRAAMPGALIQRIDLTQAQRGKLLDLTTRRALAVQLEVEAPAPALNEKPVLNLQLEAAGKGYRDYYIDLDSSGPRTIVLAEPGTNRMLAEFRPAPSNYPFKDAMNGVFDYANVVALNLRWMRYPKGSGARCRMGRVEALQERSGVLSGVEIRAGSSSIAIPGELKTGDYAEYWADGTIRVFDRNGVLLSTAPAKAGPQLKAGGSQVALKAAGPGVVVFTAITMGE